MVPYEAMFGPFVAPLGVFWPVCGSFGDVLARLCDPFLSMVICADICIVSLCRLVLL